MKKYLGIFLIICLTLLASCNAERAQDHAEDGLYFIKRDAYLGYATQESPTLNLYYINVLKKGSQARPQLKSLTLQSDQGEIVVDKFSIAEGDKGNGYALDSLFLELPQLSVGTYRISEVKITSEDETEASYNIGSWKIVVKDMPASPFSFDRMFSGSNLFELYFAEIINESNEDIYINSLEFELETNHPTVSILSSSRLEDEQLLENNVLPAKEMRLFNFQLTSDAEKTKAESFFAIRPFLRYTQSGQEYYALMDTAYYTPVFNDEEIFQLLDSFSSLPTK